MRAAIPRGHKVALHDIAAGDVVRKYGWPIGHAILPIAAGDHVHTQNLTTSLSGVEHYQAAGRVRDAAPAPHGSAATFQGYRRPDGRAATRNEIWIINTVACVNVPSQRIADLAARRFVTPGGPIDGIHAFTHPYGCPQLGDDLLASRIAGQVIAADALDGEDLSPSQRIHRQSERVAR